MLPALPLLRRALVLLRDIRPTHHLLLTPRQPLTRSSNYRVTFLLLLWLALVHLPKRKTDAADGGRSLSQAEKADYLVLAWEVGNGGYFESPRAGTNARKSGRHWTYTRHSNPCRDLPKSVGDVPRGESAWVRVPPCAVPHPQQLAYMKFHHVSDWILR